MCEGEEEKVCIAVVLKAGCTNGSLNGCVQRDLTYLQTTAAFVNVPAFASVLEREGEGVSMCGHARKKMRL